MKLLHPYRRRNFYEEGVSLKPVGASLDRNLRPYSLSPDFQQVLFLRVKEDIMLLQYALKDIAQSL